MSSDNESEEFDPSFEPRELAWQFGCKVSLVQPGLVLKQGTKVRPSEEAAMRLVKEHLPHVPIPNIHGLHYKYDKGISFYGEIYMDFVPGKTLKEAWADLDEASKSRVCQDIWDVIAEIRTMPRPDDLPPGLYRTVDGSPSRDPLLASNSRSGDMPPRELDDDTLRNLIYTRYEKCHGFPIVMVTPSLICFLTLVCRFLRMATLALGTSLSTKTVALSLYLTGNLPDGFQTTGSLHR